LNGLRELSEERKQNVQRQPSQRGGGVEVLRDGHETGPLLVQHGHDPREIQQRALDVRGSAFNTSRSPCCRVAGQRVPERSDCHLNYNGPCRDCPTEQS